MPGAVDWRWEDRKQEARNTRQLKTTPFPVDKYRWFSEDKAGRFASTGSDGHEPELPRPDAPAPVQKYHWHSSSLVKFSPTIQPPGPEAGLRSSKLVWHPGRVDVGRDVRLAATRLRPGFRVGPEEWGRT